MTPIEGPDSFHTAENEQTNKKEQAANLPITGPALEQFTKSGIADRLVGIMRQTFNNPNIQVQNCTFTAGTRRETLAGNSRTSRGIVVRVNGSDTLLSFGFDQTERGAELGHFPLSQTDAAIVQRLFPQATEQADKREQMSKAVAEEMQKNADLRVKRAEENRRTEDAERRQELAQASRKIDALPDQFAITGPALEQFTKSGIADRLVGIMRQTFNNPNIQVQNCTFTAGTRRETLAGNSRTSRGIVVRVNGSDTLLSFGFDQTERGARLGQLQLNGDDVTLVQSLFR